MGYDLYVIKPEHWDEYEHDVLSVLHKIRDDWYVSEEHEDSHQIWREWRNDYYTNDEDQEIPFPGHLQMFYYSLHDSKDALSVADQLIEFAGDDISIRSFAEWLQFWGNKGARFYLST